MRHLFIFLYSRLTCVCLCCLTGLRLLSGRELAVLLCSGGCGGSDDGLAMLANFVGEWPSPEVYM